MEAPQYRILEEQLLDADTGLRPAELHGALCGQVCATQEMPGSEWLDLAAGSPVPPEQLHAGTLAMLDELFAWTVAGLDDLDFSFELYLPDDDEPLADRAEAFGLWCGAFLAALGQLGVGDPAGLPEEAGEFVRDLTEMARAGFETDVDSDADEAAYVELVEYARVGAMVIYETLRGPDQGSAIH